MDFQQGGLLPLRPFLFGCCHLIGRFRAFFHLAGRWRGLAGSLFQPVDFIIQCGNPAVLPLDNFQQRIRPGHQGFGRDGGQRWVGGVCHKYEFRRFYYFDFVTFHSNPLNFREFCISPVDNLIQEIQWVAGNLTKSNYCLPVDNESYLRPTLCSALVLACAAKGE